MPCRTPLAPALVLIIAGAVSPVMAQEAPSAPPARGADAINP
jgi:hypothetical protein